MPTVNLLTIDGKVFLKDPTGTVERVNVEDAKQALESGYAPAALDEWNKQEEAREYDRPGEAALTGFIRGASMGVLDLAAAHSASKSGDSRITAHLRRLKEYNPWASGAGEVAGVAGSAFAPGTAASVIARGAASVGERAAARIGARQAERLLAQEVLPPTREVAERAASYVAGKGALGRYTNSIVRGIVEGDAYALSSAASDIALSPEDMGAAKMAATIGRHMLSGTAIGGGVGAGIPALRSLGATLAGRFGRGRKLLAEGAELQQKLDASRASKIEELAALESRRVAEAVDRRAAEDAYKELHRRAVGHPEVGNELRGTMEQLDSIKASRARLGEADAAIAAADGELKLARDAASRSGLVGEDAVPMFRAKKVVDELRAGIPGTVDGLDDRLLAIERGYLSPAQIEASAEKNIHHRLNSILKYGDAVPPSAKSKTLTMGEKIRELEYPLRIRHGEAGQRLADAEAAFVIAAKVNNRSLAAAMEKLEASAPGGITDKGIRAATRSAAEISDLERKLLRLQTEKDTAIAGVPKEHLDDSVLANLEAQRDRLMQLSGLKSELDAAKKEITKHAAVDARIEELKKLAPDELEWSNRILEINKELSKGGGGTAKQAAKRYAGLLGAQLGRGAVERVTGATAYANRFGMGGNPLAGAMAQTTAATLSPWIMRALDAVLGGGEFIASAAKAVAGAAGKGGRLVAPAVRSAGQWRLQQDDDLAPRYDDVANELQQGPDQAAALVRAGMVDQPADMVEAAADQRRDVVAFLQGKMPRDPRVGQKPVYIQTSKWNPSDAQRNKFMRYVMAANLGPPAFMLNMVSGKLTPEAVETMATLYPDFLEGVRAAIRERLSSNAAEGVYPKPATAKQLDVLFQQDGPRVNPSLAIFQAAFRPRRTEPLRGRGASGKISQMTALGPGEGITR